MSNKTPKNIIRAKRLESLEDFKTATENLLLSFSQEISNCSDSGIWETLRIEYLGKKEGLLTILYQLLRQVAPEDKKNVGEHLNKIKQEITQALEQKKSELAELELNHQLASEHVDVTLPTPDTTQGRIHPVTQVLEEITTIFAAMGFAVAEGPDIEDDEHNFNALNIPESHPARQMHDTFYLEGDGKNPALLRTHTSPVQIRAMRAGQPPFRVIAPGATYRCDSDITHTPMFHQVEGLVIDKDTHMGHLKGCLIEFLQRFFEVDDVPVRFRPSFFPFTEPSAEVDIGCSRSRNEIKIGAGTEWLEVMGCGMVHPNVLRNCNIDPDEWQGFAFGMGVERLAMLKYNIPDLRTFFENDVRWLKHYGFGALHIPSQAGGL